MGQEHILVFQGTWRSYQKRILDNLQAHLRDNKLHVVAAPGAGKTTLGIEVIGRTGRRALVLCPTNTIKNQWRERICASFLQEKDYGLVSTDIRQPQFITVVTYQALLAAFCGNDVPEEDPSRPDEEDVASITSSARFRQEKADEIVAILKAAGISLLCFDEAHHLRKEWWKALIYLNEHLVPEQTLALTATPPYDADPAEWKRYQELCGEIDEVISIPELVKNGDLCPHQDYIYFSSLSQEEKELLNRHKENVGQLIRQLKADRELLDGLSRLPFLQADESAVETVLENPEFYVSAAALLHGQGYPVPGRFLALFEASAHSLPAFDVPRAATFLDGFFNAEGPAWAPLEQKREEYLRLARRMSIVDGRKAVLEAGDKYYRQIANSVGKLDSIVHIVRQESALLRERLRMVILADYIKLSDPGCTTLGVVPIWRKLKDMPGLDISLGVLCGSLILLPKGAMESWRQRLASSGIAPDAVAEGRFDDNRYVRLTPREGIRNHIVRLVTDLFNDGVLTVLVGTQALLGEGWDAPSINSLILSSTVSSYMLSNQMRGRAIRTDRNHPDKVSNIWHLAVWDPLLGENTADIAQLKARFEGFEAPSYYDKHEIVSGIERILGSSVVPLQLRVQRIRDSSLTLSKDRELIRKWWEEALYDSFGKRGGLRTGVKTEAVTLRTLRYVSLKYIILSVLSLAGALLDVTPFLSILCLVGLAGFLSIAFVRFLRTGSVTGVLKQVSRVILESLAARGHIKTSLKQVGLTVTGEKGILYVNCANLPAQENNLFIQALQEFLDPIDNPRYLLVKHDRFLGRIRQKDYFAVPAILSPNKESVEGFRTLWEKYIGKCEMVYTRNAEGRRLLVKARKMASSASKRRRSKRLSQWQ